MNVKRKQKGKPWSAERHEKMAQKKRQKEVEQVPKTN
jgi:hypothetical protein